MSASENAIEIQGLKKAFGEIEAVRGIDLTIARGEMFGIVGPDGAGKTTLIRTLCGILKPDGGSARVLGLELASQLEEIKKRIGYLSQRFTLYPDLSVDENIEFFAEIHEVKDYKARRNELLEFTRLTPFRTRLADKLSGGMKQKLALACTLVHTPDIIFLDEPTTGVDPVSRRDFWKILSELLKNGITILMATPYLDEAERCSRVALMTGGEILVADTPQNVKRQMKEKIIEIVAPDIHRAFDTIKRMPAAKEVQAFGDRLNVVIAADHNENEIERYLKSEGIEVTQVRTVQPSLENVFISLMKQEVKTVSPLLFKEGAGGG
ncbi:MAG TPA: ABC transporter ATP-binding protein [Candidatus Kapabacteria bacterium]|jgi:ABC-2 type transport system ATP-binding protein|nr:ABC transporter ATP-binding protein [Candidatus Kapabacteria bacterium]